MEDSYQSYVNTWQKLNNNAVPRGVEKSILIIYPIICVILRVATLSRNIVIVSYFIQAGFMLRDRVVHDV